MPVKKICPVCGRLDYLVSVEIHGKVVALRCRVCDSPWICIKTEYGWLFKHELDENEYEDPISKL